MPYRRLPNTDLARLRALRIAFEKGRELHPFQLAFTQSTYQNVQSNLPVFERAVQESRYAFNVQVEKGKEYARLLKKVKLYMSHFIQVTNMAIARGDLSPSDRDYFGFSRDQSKVPLFSTENEVIEWGEKLIHGEKTDFQSRTAEILEQKGYVIRINEDMPRPFSSEFEVFLKKRFAL